MTLKTGLRIASVLAAVAFAIAALIGLPLPFVIWSSASAFVLALAVLPALFASKDSI